MGLASILVKLSGLVLFAFTGRSVYKHIRAKFVKKTDTAGLPAVGHRHGHSKVEHALNAVLLYAWFIFMIALSLGMVFNN